MIIKLPENVEKLIALAEKNNEKAYVVGGCVRDSILGKSPTDWDITISCPPDKTKEIYKKFKTVDTGIKYGTVTVLVGKEAFEITTFRSETGYGDLRHPEEIAFERNIKSDLKRRDFTINAIAYNPKEGFVDLFGGIKDIEKGCIKCVGDPSERFNEDALRILRAIRFESTLGFACEEKTFEAIFENAFLLKGISKERIKQETDKMFLNGKNVGKTLKKYEKVFLICCESLKEIKNIDNIDNFKGKEKWAKFLLSSDIEKVASELKFSKEEKKYCQLISKFYNKNICQSLKETRFFIKENKEESLRKVLDFKRKNGENTKKAEAFLLKIKEEGLCCTLKELKVSGNDLMEKGVKEKEIKSTLNRLLDAVIEEKCPNTKEELLKWI